MPDGGTTEVSYGWAIDTSDGGRTRSSVSDGQPKIGSVTEMAETGQGRDGGAVQRLVLKPGTLATGSLTVRALGHCSGRGVDQTSGLTLEIGQFLPDLPPEANPEGWQRVAGGR